MVYRIAQIYDLQSNEEMAVIRYRDFLRLTRDSENSDAYFTRQRAKALFRTGEISRAYKLLEKAIEQFPNEVEIANDYAELLITQKEYDKALEVLNRIEKNNP